MKKQLRGGCGIPNDEQCIASHAHAKPQSSPLPLPVVVEEWKDGAIRLTCESGAGDAYFIIQKPTANDREVLAEIVRRVNQGPPFDAMLAFLELLRGSRDFKVRMSDQANDELDIALKLVQEAGK